MSDATAARGYVTDIGYTAGFYPETAPAHLAFALWSAGRDPGPPPARVLELGFGQGFGLCLLAAASPDTAFEGHDFNARHVAGARVLATCAGLANLTLAQSNFSGLAALDGARDSDVILAHGVMSWVAPPVRQAVMEIARQRLRDGGSMLASYNSLPGWARLLPLLQLAAAVREAAPGGSAQAIAQTLALLAALQESGAEMFMDNRVLATQVSGMRQRDPAYLAHEYLSEGAAPLAFAQMAELAAGAGLAYSASATTIENFDACCIAPALLALLDATENGALRETLRDMMLDKQFRRDIFARPSPQRAAPAVPGFVLAVPPHQLDLDIATPRPSAAAPLLAPMLEAIAGGMADFDALASLPACRDAPPAVLREGLALLVRSGQVLPLMRPPAQDRRPAHRFNRFVADFARTGRLHTHLASPVARTGIPVGEFGLLALAALSDGEAGDAERAGRHGLETVKRLGARPAENGVPIEDDAAAAGFLARHLSNVIADWFPVWHRLGVIRGNGCNCGNYRL